MGEPRSISPRPVTAPIGLARLKRALDRLGAPIAPVPDGWRTLPGGDPHERAAALLEEIDATVLGRRLALRAGPDKQLHLTVRGRRLLGVTQDAGTGAISSELSPEDWGRTIAGWLKLPAVALRVHPLEGHSAPADTGVSVATLEKALTGCMIAAETGADGAAVPSDGGGLAGFCRSVASRARAWRVEGPHAEVTQEDSSMQPGLAAALADWHRQRDGTWAEVLLLSDGRRHSLCLLALGHEAAALALSASSDWEILSLWSRFLETDSAPDRRALDLQPIDR